jgi:hypothetical protein
MREWRRKGVCRSDLKITASDPGLAAITKDLEALNDAWADESRLGRSLSRRA